ncbi:MAG: MBL fold metallo-hydrolase [Coriobacteriia bacterium]|nr:MBL fold metallo-hydrolase [Coriobacteriia bacterium]
MRLTVLGSGASYPGAGHACAGHVVEHDGAAILLDCGNGVLANLAKLMDPTRLAAVFVTHAHIDHFADVYALQAALRWAPEGPCPPLDMHLPPGLFERLGAMLTARGTVELAEAFRPYDIVAGRPVLVGPFAIVAVEVDHLRPTFALRVSVGQSVLAYTSDTAPGSAVAAAVRGADVIIADATLPPGYEGRAPHLSPALSAALAEEAGAHTLVLSHLWPTVDREAAAREAGERFGGRVIVADELDTIDIDS